MTVASNAKTRALYALLQVPGLCDVDAKAIISEISWHLAEQARVELGALADKDTLLVPILRGGLLLYPAFAETFRASAVGLLQVTRQNDERNVIYECLPPTTTADVVLYLDAVAGTGRTIECASRLVRDRCGVRHHYVCLVAAAGDAVAHMRRSNVTVIGVSVDEENINGLVVPDLGMRDAGDLALLAQRSAKVLEFPVAAFEQFHDLDERARKLRSDLIYRPTLDLLRSRRVNAILDIGCGSGRLTEQLAEYATSVVGYDPSNEAIAVARNKSHAPNIRYTSSISAEMVGAFDFVVCCMVLNSTESFERVVEMAASCSKPASSQAWTIFHPAFQYNESQWRSRKAISPENLAMSFSVVPSYFEEHAFNKQVGDLTLTEHHRPLATYFNSLIEHGFLISRIAEPQPEAMHDGIVEQFLPRTLVIATTRM